MEAYQEALADGTFVKLTLGGARGGPYAVQNVFVRIVDLKAGRQLAFVYRHAKKDVTKNFPIDESSERVSELIGSEFRTAHLFTTAFSLQLECRSGREPRLIRHKVEQPEIVDTRHDRTKERSVATTSRWLHGLGVTTADGSVRDGMTDKFRQIGRFVELLEHQLKDLDRPKTEQLTLVDMGCGKGYLTFAAYEHLRATGWEQVVARGIEVRPDLVSLCNRVAVDTSFGSLSFEAGTIDTVSLEAVDILVALHACNTATDDALAKGVAAGASIILTSPCCHQEVRPQWKPPAVLEAVTRHGILEERLSEMATDALRAALLEWSGYRTSVIEFISTEHTGKNLMIIAVKRKGPVDRESKAGDARQLAAFFGIQQQRLAQALGFPLEATV